MKLKSLLFLLSIFIINDLFAQSSLDNILAPDRLPYLKASKLVQISSFDSTGGNDDRITMKVGETATLAEMSGPGIITRIWVTIASPDPYFLRRMVLRMYWDNEDNPSVEVPVGDFFGTGFEYRHYLSMFTGMSSGGYFCYFPMPFQQSARIEVENQTGQEVHAFYYHIDYQKLEQPLPADVAYFHAQWHRELRTDPAQNYLILAAEGQGHFVGVNMSMQSYEGRLWFLEGDEMVYVDGENFPSVYGTGTEDYFTSGWYFNRGEFAGPYHGLILKDDSTARIATYRFHVGDVIPFKKSLLFTIEHGHGNREIADYSSTAFWYQKEPHRQFPPLLKASLRIPLRQSVPNGAIEAESLKLVGDKANGQIEDMSDIGPDWSGLKQLKVTAPVNSDFIIEIPVDKKQSYNVHLYSTRAPGYGQVDLYYQGNKVGALDGYDSQVAPGGKIIIPKLTPVDNVIPIKFVVTGKKDQASGYAIGLDAVTLEPYRQFITDWYLIGPFPNPRDEQNNLLGLDLVYPPEQEINLEKSYIGIGNRKVKWTRARAMASGYIQLVDKFNPYELVLVYALTYIYAPANQSVPLLLGTDDGVKVFLNNKEIHRNFLIRGAAPDQDEVALELIKGWNTLLLKIENNIGGYGFYARVLDLEEKLKFSVER